MADEGKAVIILGAEDKTGPAFQSASRNMAALQKQSNRLAQNNAQLAFQLNDLFVQIVSGGNPLLAVVQQGSQLSGTFGGVGGALKAVLGLLTPVRLAFGGVAGAIGALGIAAYKGAQDSKALADALVLSGNFAGQTEGQFNSLAKTLADSSQITQGAAREFAQAIAATGQIGPELFASATEAAARFGEATGKTAEEVAKEFASMSGDVAKFAADYNRSLNFITAAQFEQIKTLQEAGREVDAQKIVYDALNERFRKLDNNLGFIDQALKLGAKTWSSWWEAAKGVGKAETVDDQLAAVQKRLNELNSATPFKNGSISDAIGSVLGGENFRQGKVAEAKGQQSDLLKRSFRESENAFAESDRAQTNKTGIAARQRLDNLLDQTKTSDNLSKALAQNAKDFKAAAAAGAAYTEAEQKAINDATTKKFTDRSSKRRDREPDQIRRAELDSQLKGIQAGLEEEQASVRFNNDFLRGQYQEGEVSLREFYSRQREEIDRGVSAKVKALENERAAIDASLAKTQDPSERIQLQTRRDDIGAEIKKTGDDASRERALAIQAEAKSYKDLTDSVREFQAQLDQAAGQDFKSETARIETTIQRAQTLATQSGGSITSDQIQTLREQLTIRAQINESQRQFSTLSSQAATAEERLVISARASGKGTLEGEAEIRAVRQKALDQLGSLIEQTKAYAANSKDPSVLQFLDDLQTKYATLQATVDPTKLRLDAAADNIGDSIADGMARAVVEGGKLSDIISGIEKDILSIVARETITKPIADSVSGFIRGAGGQGTGQNLIGQLFGLNQPKATVTASPMQVGGSNVLPGESAGVPDAGGFLGGFLGGADSIVSAFTSLAVSTTAQVAATGAATAANTTEATSSAAATTALGGLTIAAQSAATALASIAASGGGKALGDAASLFQSSGGDSSFLAAFFHEGGVVADGNDFRQVFGSAPRYHTGGLAGLKPDEVPAVLLKNEEVLTRDDPRHRDNLSTKVFERIQSMKDGASLASLDGFDLSGIKSESIVSDKSQSVTSRIERMASDKSERVERDDEWSEVERYHTGGIAGLAADEVPAVLKKGEEVLTEADPRHRDNFGGGNTIEQHFHFKGSKPTRQTMSQVGAEASRGLRNSERNL